MWNFAQKKLNVDVLTISPILQLWSFLLISLLELKYAFDFTSTGYSF